MISKQYFKNVINNQNIIKIIYSIIYLMNINFESPNIAF